MREVFGTNIMACHQIQELFGKCWFIMNEGISDLEKKGQTGCRELEHNFRSFHQGCISKLDDLFKTVPKQSLAPHEDEYIDVIHDLTQNLCKQLQFCLKT